MWPRCWTPPVVCYSNNKPAFQELNRFLFSVGRAQRLFLFESSTRRRLGSITQYFAWSDAVCLVIVLAVCWNRNKSLLVQRVVQMRITILWGKCHKKRNCWWVKRLHITFCGCRFQHVMSFSRLWPLQSLKQTITCDKQPLMWWATRDYDPYSH